MTKKLLALLLALTLMLSFTSAFAEIYKVEEDFTTFDVSLTLPEGAQSKQNIEEGWICVEITFDENKPLFDLNIAPSEDFDGKSLADFTDEEKQLLIDQMEDDFYHSSSEFFLTPSGNMILLMKEETGDVGYAAMITLYRGFYFSLHCNYADYRPLTDADIDLMHKITEGTDIIAVTK